MAMQSSAAAWTAAASDSERTVPGPVPVASVRPAPVLRPVPGVVSRQGGPGRPGGVTRPGGVGGPGWSSGPGRPSHAGPVGDAPRVGRRGPVAARSVRGGCAGSRSTAVRAPLRLTARGRRAVVALVLAAGLGIWALLGTVLAEGSDGLHLAGDSSVVVESGDTLWSIASAVAGNDQDVRVVVEQIRQINGLGSGDLMPGQVLQLP
jgi:nucleoid-associated protein YgaU